jgi:phospholipid/cholesterol/gamma-HCH transport system substrate-binding protein
VSVPTPKSGAAPSPPGRRPRRRRRRIHPLAIAVAVILGASAVTFYAFNGGLPFVHHFTLYAVVHNSYNVRDGDPVRIDGVDVGQVEGVSADGDDSKIAFSLSNSALPIHRDATLTIRDRLFLEGSYYLQLEPGTPEAPALGDGGTIPVGRTSGPVQFYQLLSVFTQPIRQSLADSLEGLDQGFGQPPGQPLSQSGAAGLKQSAPQLAPLFDDAAIVSQSLRGTEPFDLARLLRSTRSVAGTLAANSARLVGLVDGLDRTSTALVSSDGALAHTISGIDQTLVATPPALRAVDGSLPAVDRLARALNPSLVQAPPILDHLTGVVDRVAAVLAPAERASLLTSLRATFKQLPNILTQLASAFPIGQKLTSCFVTHIIPILVQHVPDGSLSSGGTVLQDFMHFLPGLAGASGNFDGDGPYTRFLIGAGDNTLAGSFHGGVVGTPPPGGGSVEGARPHWIGDLQPSDFRPDVPCSSQKLPSLSATTVPSDLDSAK